ncbi:MAG: hypothetical protein H6701_10505 [Myxococcales bacterium]|nr:hypothetical protein [Myxococcales bacterium]
MHLSDLWRLFALCLALGLTACVPVGGGGGGDDDDDGVDEDGGTPSNDRGVDPDDGVPPPDLGPDPDDGVPPPDRGPDPEPDPDDGVPPPDRGPEPDPDAALVDIGPDCEPAAETCNDIDDDCDGRVDEDLGGDRCNTGQAGVCATGQQRCLNGELRCSPVIGAEPEVCDALDNDCNGVIDDVEGVGAPCQSGVGACRVAGSFICRGAELTCDAVPRPAGAEICGAADEDCDGRVDEGGVCNNPVEDCDNGRDDDGDGRVDCDDADCAADPACAAPLRPNVMLCGVSERDISVIFGAADPVVVIPGCAPDNRTQALFVSRNGAINGAAVAAWIQGGGQLITEFSVTDTVFNAVFGTNVIDGAFTGSCYDNVNPVVRFNEQDPFWIANGALPREPAATSGCGYNLAAFPGITRLGGWNANAVSLAYRDLGAGRFWLVEGDWQDASGDVGAFNAATRQLLRYMAIGRAGVGPGPGPGDGIPLAPNQAYGHHGNCNSFNACGNAQTCADLACQNNGLGVPALDFEQGNCSSLAAGAVPTIVCNLFNNLDPNSLDVAWGPSGGCDIPVVYAVVCSEP